MDRVLKDIANRGVKIMILMYKEPTIALTMDSAHSKNILRGLS